MHLLVKIDFGAPNAGRVAKAYSSVAATVLNSISALEYWGGSLTNWKFDFSPETSDMMGNWYD
jgi:hypothetical protein